MRNNYLLMQVYLQLKQILATNGLTPAEGYFILQTILGEVKEAVNTAIDYELEDQEKKETRIINIDKQKQENSGQE